MDLKWLLVRRITLVALACFIAGTALAIYQTARKSKRHNAELVEMVGRQLDLQLSRIGRSTDIPKRFPDWDLVASLSLQPGQCVALHGVDGALQRSSCAGVDASSIGAPQWFLAAYRWLINGALSATRPLSYRKAPLGTLVVEQDAVATAGKAWATIAPLLGFSAIFVAVSVPRHLFRHRSCAAAGEGRACRFEPPGARRSRLPPPRVPLGRAQPH